MEISVPNFLIDLCDKKNIRPFSYYVNREPWSLKTDRVENAFLNKKGVYCFWWSGPIKDLINGKNNLSYNGYKYSLNQNFFFEHKMIPLYIGMTSKAAILNGNRLFGRLIDRLVRFPKIFQEYKVKKEGRYSLCKKKTGTCGNFDLFNFPEQIRQKLSLKFDNENLTLQEAETLLYQNQEIVEHYAEKYKDIFFHNYSISFRSFSKETEMFYAEAMAIGYLRPWLNHS
jgi:hypothetical protein